MISEHKFAASYTSFWRTALPLGDPFVRHMNSHLQGFAEPYEFTIPSEKSALLSELSYRLFIRGGVRKGDLLSLGSWELSVIQQESTEALRYLSRLRGFSHTQEVLSSYELEIAVVLAQRLRKFFLLEIGMEPLLPMPRFEGCGILGDCQGDVLAGSILYEIKNVDRGFRIVDVRQVLAYCALNYSKELHQISGVGWINARTGKFYRIGLASLATIAAGNSISELLSDIVNFLSIEQAST